MKKKIIFVTHALWIGGIETALVNLLNSMDYDKYDVTCLVLTDITELAPGITGKCRIITADRRHTVSFERAYKYSRLYDLMEEPQNAGRFRCFVWKALSFFLKAPEARLYAAYIRGRLKETFDTVVIYNDRTAETAVRGVRGERYLMFYHHGAMRHMYHDELGYKKCERIIAVSEGLCEKLKEYRPEYAYKITAVNNLTNIEYIRKMAEASPDIKFPDDAVNIVSCGRIAPEKGFDLAAEACALLVRGGFTDIRWWAVGGGPCEGELARRIEELGIEEYFHILGMRRNPYPYIKRADIYVQPSRFEGHCVSVMEAKLLGRPIAATFAAAVEQIKNGENGLLCGTDPQSIADAVKTLYENTALRERFTENLEKYDFEEDNRRIIKRLEELF